MHPAYFETHFECDQEGGSWPRQFAIITAYATTRENWVKRECEATDRTLELELRQIDRWLCRMTGYSPVTGHAEPGWAVEIGFQVACDLGVRFRQDAIYFVIDDTLHVSYCDGRRELVAVGQFRSRVRSAGKR